MIVSLQSKTMEMKIREIQNKRQKQPIKQKTIERQTTKFKTLCRNLKTEQQIDIIPKDLILKDYSLRMLCLLSK